MAANCPTVVNPTYEPTRTIISAIGSTNPMEVTTTDDHNYSTGLIVRLYIPTDHGMQQVNQQYASITVTAATTFTMPFDATRWDPFTVPADAEQCAEIVPIGADNDKLELATRNVL